MSRSILHKIIQFSFIGLIVFLTVNKGVFLHSHITADGKVIVHAHPYQKSNNSKAPVQHHHSAKDLSIVDALDQTFLNTSAEFKLCVAFSLKKQPQSHSKVLFPNKTLVQQNFQRGPPVV